MKISFLKPSKIIKILNNSKSGQKSQKFCLKKLFLLLKYHRFFAFLVHKKNCYVFLGDFIWNHPLKRGKFIFNHYFSPSFEELLCSPIVHMNHMESMFQDLPFYCTKKVPKIHNNFFSLSSQGWNSLPGACSDLDLFYQY